MKWECDRCGGNMRKNTTECPDCGHTIHSAASSSESSLLGILGDRSSPSQSTSASGEGQQWRCAKCEYVHESKPFTCHECGSSWLQPVSTSESASISASGETISNVSEIDSSGNSLVDYLFMPIVAVYLLVWSVVRFWKLSAVIFALVCITYYFL